ncbi:MAG TPA: sulfatase-like hydrolase/transferase [Acidobacteriaceae bacterium]|nr:sulfatase-like hydrolase/transferase [Acidobacteriaceae bacterium]
MLTNRRNFMLGSAATATAGFAAAALGSDAEPGSPAAQGRRPNIILYLADQFRWDFVGANRLNRSTHTPNLDAMAERGTLFTHAITNQPVCSPSRSVMLTGRYATETGVWHNALPIDPSLPTLAGELRKAGYTANLLGKWHLAPGTPEQGGGRGYVKPEYRGGFLDHWEGANEFEFTTHPYEGTIYDGEGKEITFKDQFRVDFVTDRAEQFLRQPHDKPFLLFISQLEPHFQNDAKRFVAPKGAAERFQDAFVPSDLRALPGNWQSQLPDYYGCCEAIDVSVGRIRKILEEEHLADNTILVFISDHGCQFMTRNEEYKRSPHNSSIRIPLIIEGPGFNGSQRVDEIVGNLHITPTLLEAAGVAAPPSIKGRSLLPLLSGRQARQEWPNQELIQISEAMVGRAIRTEDWLYCVADPEADVRTTKGSAKYQEYLFYDERGDPSELVNLAARKEYRKQAEALRAELKKLIVASGETEPEILPARLYP